MTNTPTKRKGRLAGRPQRSAPAKVQIAEPETIPLPAKHKRILSDAHKAVTEALRVGWRINSNIVNGERTAFVDNVAALARVFRRGRRLSRGVSAVARHARKEVAQ